MITMITALRLAPIGAGASGLGSRLVYAEGRPDSLGSVFRPVTPDVGEARQASVGGTASPRARRPSRIGGAN